jgi:hypothetical protein
MLETSVPRNRKMKMKKCHFSRVAPFMKILIKKLIRSLWLIFVVLALAVLGASGCATSNQNPLEAWKILFAKDYERLDPAIREDYQSYIANLPRGEQNGVGPIAFFEDGTGQHAVKIEIASRGTDWAHVLFYDKNDKRIKVIKFIAGRYAS